MRITFYASTTETVEYLRVVNSIMQANKSTDDSIKAYKALKDLVLSVDKRLGKLEDSERRNKVCR